MQLGKVHNLRIVAQKLNGVFVPAGETFSFWRQVGKATRRHGFVFGRELREGCIVAAVGGGICQASNALYALALRAGFQIDERHPHTRRVPGSAAEEGNDATVAWNHIDLRFTSDKSYQIEAFLTDTEFVIRFRTANGGAELTPPKANRSLRVLGNDPGSCETCGQDSCFEYRKTHAVKARTSSRRTAYLLDASWPEFRAQFSPNVRDLVLLPLDAKLFSASRYDWSLPEGVEKSIANDVGLRRSMALRKRLSPPQYRAAQLRWSDILATRYHKKLPFDADCITVDISLIKELYRLGTLGGRQVTVWASRFPLLLAHELLDFAACTYTESNQIKDFRASDKDATDEWKALEMATTIVTPHLSLALELQRRLACDVHVVDWELPETHRAASKGSFIYFPGPTATREGARAVRDAARKLEIPVSVGGRNLESPDFWDGVQVLSPGTHPMEESLVVVAPGIFKNRPTELLRARAMGKPIIATRNMGVDSALFVPYGDADAICDSIRLCQASETE